jgi:putative transposase
MTEGSIRLQGYDYTQDGAYFVTLCTHQRALLFGDVVGDDMELNTLGCIVLEEWERTATLRPYIELDAFVIMPNHLHGIIIINWGDVGARRAVPLQTEWFGKPVSDSIPTVVRAFKSATTRRVNQVRLTPGEPVWQRNYYEHIIRSEGALNQIRQYIHLNPANWLSDENHPGSFCSTSGLHTF